MTTLEKIVKDNKEKILALAQAGVFEMPSGKAEINIHNSQIQSVQIYQTTYKLSTK